MWPWLQEFLLHSSDKFDRFVYSDFEFVQSQYNCTVLICCVKLHILHLLVISYISSDAAVFLYFRISLPWLLWTHNFCFAQVLCQIVTSRLMHPCSSSYWSCWVLVHLGTTTCSSFYGRRDQLHPLKLLLGGTHGWGSVAVPPGDPCSCGPTTLSLAPTLGIAHLI